MQSSPSVEACRITCCRSTPTTVLRLVHPFSFIYQYIPFYIFIIFWISKHIKQITVLIYFIPCFTWTFQDGNLVCCLKVFPEFIIPTRSWIKLCRLLSRTMIIIFQSSIFPYCTMIIFQRGIFQWYLFQNMYYPNNISIQVHRITLGSLQPALQQISDMHLSTETIQFVFFPELLASSPWYHQYFHFLDEVDWESIFNHGFP